MLPFACIIVGDEILSGRRQDQHLQWLIATLARRGIRLSAAHYLADDPAAQSRHYRSSMALPQVVFSFGGIGATPDDHSRQAAADAADLPLIQHPEATALIEARSGESARPQRIRMAQLPQGCALIPNPVNQVPGFSLGHHHFVPGFPQMAWPMVEWVLDQYYPELGPPRSRKRLIALHAREGDLIEAMEQLVAQWPDLSFSSLPSYGSSTTPEPHIEFCLEGEPAACDSAMNWLEQVLRQKGYVVRAAGGDGCIP